MQNGLTYYVPEGMDLGSQRWNTMTPNLRCVVTEGPADKRTEEKLDYISWEFRRYKVKSEVEEFVFKNRYLTVMGGQPYMPGHPTMLSVQFINCEFGPGCYLANCPRLNSMRIENCVGTIELRYLQIKKLWVGDENDLKCLKLAQ